MSAKTLTPTRKLKVYCVGAHSTGKSHLGRWISSTYRLPRIAEVARTELAKLEVGFDRLRVDVERTSQYQRDVFAAQLAAEKGLRRFVSDRAFLDNLAYFSKWGRGLRDVVSSQSCRHAADSMREGIGAGEVVVFFVRPQTALLAKDGTRAEGDLDVAGVWAIDGAVQFMLEAWDLDYVPIETSCFKDRCRVVEAVLKGKV